MRAALSPKLRETAYALACEVIAGEQDPKPKRQSLEMLDFVRAELGLDPLVSAAHRTRGPARHQRVDSCRPDARWSRLVLAWSDVTGASR